ncbi:MAG: hypothetical protein ACJ72E_04475 [Marmoricola sp.]
MVKNKRLRLVGLLAALAVPVALGTIVPADALNILDPSFSPCSGISGNVVRNCGFEQPESGSSGVPGWTHLVSQNSFVSTDTSNSGADSLRFGATVNDDVWTQTVAVKPNTQYLVGASVKALGSSPVNDLTISVTNEKGNPAGGSTIFTTHDTQIGNWTRVGAFVTTGSARTMTITIAGANAPSESYVDDVFVVAQQAGCALIANNAVKNCGFEGNTDSPWVHTASTDSGTSGSYGYGGTHGLFFASTGSDDVWHQTIAVRPHTTYTLRYMLQSWSGSVPANNDLTISLSNVATPGGKLTIARTNIPNQFWKPEARTFTTGAGTVAVLTLAGRNSPSGTSVDDFSLTVAPKIAVSKSGTKVVTKLTGLGGQKVQLQKLVRSHWVVVHTFTAPTTGVTKAWALKVPKGKYRAVAKSAPGYVQVTSNTVKR